MWTITKLASETIRSIRAAHGLLLTIIVVLLVGAGLFEARTIAGIDQRYNEWIAAGGMLFSIEGADTGIPGQRCDNLASHPFVLLSGGAGQANAPTEEIAFTKSPDVDYPIVKMTLGAAVIAGLDTPTEPGVILGPAIASELGVNNLDHISIQDSITQAHVLSSATRELGYDRSVLHLVPGSTSRFTGCWAELDPNSFPNGAELLAAQFSDPKQIRPFLRLDEGNHASVQFAERPSRLGWLPTGLLIALVWFGWWWTRRRELTLYQSLHVGQHGVFLLTMFEAAIITIAAAAISAIVTTQFSTHLAGTSEGLWTVAASGLTGLAASTLIATAMAQRGIATGSKDF